MTEFAPAQKILAVCLHRWIHYGFAFYLANGNTMLIWITRNSKDPVVSWREQWIPTLSHEARQECDHKLRLLPYFVLIGFFFFWFAFYSNVMIIWTCFSPPQASRNKNKWDLLALCVLHRGARAGWCIWLGVQREASGVPACVAALCPHCKSPLASWVTQGIIGLCRLI